MVTAGIAADNFVVAVYFITIFALANSRLPNTPASDGKSLEVEEEGSGAFTLLQLSQALSTSMAICWLSRLVEKGLCLDGWSIPLATGITVVIATLAPRRMAAFRRAGEAAGVLCMQIFFAATGAAGSIRLVFETAPALFIFSVIQVFVHLAITLGIGWIWFRTAPTSGQVVPRENFRESMLWNELLLASNANVGGPTTAAGMAAAKQWRPLVVPGILIGVLGYAIATFLSILLGRLVLKPMMT